MSKGFGTIVSDPPWSFDDQGSRLAPDYPTMTLDEICDLPVESRAARWAHLYLWVPSSLMAEGLIVLDAWGFAYKSSAVWVKTTLAGDKPRIGGGHYFRLAHELILFGTRGGLGVPPGARKPSVIMAPRPSAHPGKRVHSTKPEELQDIAERMSPGPRLEMFARRQRPGWTCWGDEAGGKAC